MTPLVQNDKWCFLYSHSYLLLYIFCTFARNFERRDEKAIIYMPTIGSDIDNIMP